MKKNFKRIISLLLAAVLVCSLFIISFAEEETFDSEAFASIITASDFQDASVNAFDRFAKIITIMKNDGLEDPDSVLIGGDFSKILPDYATQGVYELQKAYAGVYPNEDKESIACIQGNHDMKSSAFVKTGFYDMGSYCLYAINEDDFTWKQYKNSSAEKVQALAADVESKLNNMIDTGDTRPVIVITHVPLHHTYRSGGGDNLYSSYLFDTLNNAAEKLDIVFLFGHNHSSPYDDYIGGSVNMLKPGDTIRIPDPANKSETEYLEKTLNFTYTNYGYVGYSGNGTENGSTNILTAGVIQISENNLRFIKYSEEGLYCVDDIARKTTSTQQERTANPEINDAASAEKEMKYCQNQIIRFFYKALNYVYSNLIDIPTQLWGEIQKAFAGA